MNRIKVILADRHHNVRSTLRSILTKMEFVDWVGEADTPEGFIKLVDEQRPSVVVTDIVTPQQSCLDAIEQLQTLYPSIKFIICTTQVERAYVVRAVRVGVKGFIVKSLEPKEFEHAIRIVHNGGKFFSEEIAVLLAEEISHPLEHSGPPMSDREEAVLRMVASGNSSRQIAHALDISIRTVESYRLRLLKLFGVANTAQLILKSSHHHLV